jgi:hypothetical protein
MLTFTDVYHRMYINRTVDGTTGEKSATMSQSAEVGAAVIPQWYASLPRHGVPHGSIFKFLMSKTTGVLISP